MTFRELRLDWERKILEQALKRSGGRVSNAARALGLNRTYLYKRCAALGVAFDRIAHRGNWSRHGL